MKRNYRIIAALLSVCMCLTPTPLIVTAVGTASLSDICAEADAASPDYRIRALEFPSIDRSDMCDGIVSKLTDDRYALKSWGVFHSEGYHNDETGRGPYHAGTAIVNRRGDIIIPWQPTMYGIDVTFEDNIYSIVCPNIPYLESWKQSTQYTVSEYYDAEGQVLFAHEPYVAAGPMQDGVAWVAYTSDDYDYPLVKLIDKTGAQIADLSDKQFSYIHDFSEGLANYCYLDADRNKHYGYFDCTGKTVLESENQCGDFHNGLAWVRIDGKYGFMDTSGKIVIPAEYNALGDSKGFTAESILVKKGEYWALIDTAGKLLTDFVYTMSPRSIPAIDYGEDYVYDAGEYAFIDGCTAVYRDGKNYLLDTKGNELTKGVEAPLYCYGNGLFGVGRDWYDGRVDQIIDYNGDNVLKLDGGLISFLRNGVFWVHDTAPYWFFEVEPAATASIIPGDTNGDGITDIMDVILLNKYLLGSKELDAVAQKAADMNGDEKIDSTDSLEVLKAVLGIKSEPVTTPVTLSANNLAAAYSAQPVQTVEIDEQTILGQTKFALDLLRESAQPGKNSLVSPYSVSQALGMTANGAAGNTLQEMETVLGGSMDTLNPAFYTLRTRDTKDAKCVTANSIWMKDSYIQEYPVSKAFLQTNADYYGADAFAAPFDETTLSDINGWVNDKTDQMIPSIIEEIPNDAVMYLVNAVAFDAEWEQPYSTDQESKFTAADGTEQTVKMLCRDDFGRPYYQDEHAIGFRQDYKGRTYYFAAFLPEEGMTPEAYLDTLTAESLQKMLSNPASGKIYSEIPEFSYDFSIKLKDPLSAMGMPSAFVEGEESDFSRMAEDGEDNLFIKDVFHKTHIEVTKMGTRAGASTAVEMWAESVPIYIRLNRPFLYMIADSETNLPVFIGIVNSVQ